MRIRASRWSSALALRCLLMGAVGAALLPLGAGPALASNFQDGSNTSHTRQHGSSESGDAIGGGQVVGTAGSGDVAVTATNSADGSVAESGDATASNSMSDTFVGLESRDAAPAPGDTAAVEGSADGPRPVESLGPAVPTGSALGPSASASIAAPEHGFTPAGPPGPVGPAGLADTPSASNVQVGDNRLTYAQRADARSGTAVAGGQIVGSVQTGNVDINVSNRATNSDASSGQAEMNNSLRNVRVGSFARGPVGPVDSVVPDELQSTPDPVPPLTADDANLPADVLATVRAIEARVTSPR